MIIFELISRIGVCKRPVNCSQPTKQAEVLLWCVGNKARYYAKKSKWCHFRLATVHVFLYSLDLPKGLWDNLTISSPPSPQIFCPSENRMQITSIPYWCKDSMFVYLTWIVRSQTHHCIKSTFQLPLENCITYSWNASRKVTY